MKQLQKDIDRKAYGDNKAKGCRGRRLVSEARMDKSMADWENQNNPRVGKTNGSGPR